MESFISRYRNLTILAVLLFGQVLGLAMQVQRPTENRPTRLIRIWAVSAVTPLEKGIVGLQNGVGNLWHNYFYLRGVRQENRDLKKKIQDLEIERVRLTEDAEQAHRLQALLGFKEQFISRTIAAQVIGSSGSEQSRSIYIDKGRDDGVRADMAVITADGVVGKVLRVEKSHVSSVLLIDDQTSGVGAILEKSRLQGVLRGTPAGEVVLEKIMAGEEVQPGERILTSGGDQIFPKGLPVGAVTKVAQGPDLFLNIRVRPATDVTRLEEVLVITQEEDREPAVANAGRLRAADILAQRLPSVPDKPPTPPGTSPSTTANAQPDATSVSAQTAVVTKPANSTAPPKTKPSTTTASAPGVAVSQNAGTKPAKLVNSQQQTPIVKKTSQPEVAEPSTKPAPTTQPPVLDPSANQTPTTPPPQDQPQ
jgi:rod shape-determining protein MreC